MRAPHAAQTTNPLNTSTQSLLIQYRRIITITAELAELAEKRLGKISACSAASAVYVVCIFYLTSRHDRTRTPACPTPLL
jgi:predicted DNA-binding ribbon-helix-helix protein